jgi:5'-nucleotidase
MKKLILTIFALAALSVTSAKAQDLVILHLNDTHSHIDPERSGKNAGHAGVIETAAYVDQVRSEVGRKNVLLLHAGDFSQGT